MSGACRAGATPRAASRLELDERWARAAWAFLTEPRDAGVTRLLAECGAVEALVRLRAGQLPSRNGWDVRLPELDLDGMARAARHHGVRVLVPGDPEWPVGARPPGRAALLPVRARRPRPRGPGRAQRRHRRVAGGHRVRPARRGRPRRRAGRHAGSPSSAARPTGSTPPRTGQRSPPTGRPSPCSACGADRAYPTAHRGMLDQVAA